MMDVMFEVSHLRPRLYNFFPNLNLLQIMSVLGVSDWDFALSNSVLYKCLKKISIAKDRKCSQIFLSAPLPTLLFWEGYVTQHYLQFSRRMWILSPVVHSTFGQGTFFLVVGVVSDEPKCGGYSWSDSHLILRVAWQVLYKLLEVSGLVLLLIWFPNIHVHLVFQWACDPEG